VLSGKAEREVAAVEQLAKEWPDFPEMTSAIHEYEARQTDEAKFVYALDKLMPILLNYLNQGRSWQHHGVTFEKFVAEKEAKVPISPEIYAYYKELLAILQEHLDFFANEKQLAPKS
jgi:putative hydrolase of HD superfamily